MDDLFSKAVDVLGPLQSTALNALDSTLNEYPTPSADESPLSPLQNQSSTHDSVIGFAPSAIEAAKRVLSFWQDFDLEQKKSAWDEQGVAISQNQETSARNRKQLADQTRAFKNGDKKDFASLLKSYQAEVDNLTKRAKHAEAAYLAIYQLLYDAPDVVPSLKAFVDMVDRISIAEQEARRCRQGLEIMRRDASNAKAQLANLRRLEERNALLESEMDSKVAAMVEEQKKEIGKELDAALAKEAALMVALQEKADALLALQRQYDDAQSQLFELEEQTEEHKATKQDELEKTLEELERAHDRIRSLDSARLELSSEVDRLAALVGGQSARNGSHGKAESESLEELENSLSQKDKFISTLQDQIQNLEGMLSGEREKYEVGAMEAEKKIEELMSTCEALRTEIAGRPTVQQLEELQKQNHILQELIGSDMDDGLDSKNGENELFENSDMSRMHQMLKHTNRKLAAELTSAKALLSEKQADAEEASQKSMALEQKNRELLDLVAKLEEDIIKGIGSKQGRDGWGGGSPAVMSQLVMPGDREDAKMVPDGSRQPQGDGTIVDIVCGQRERFRKRVKELEEENARLHDSLGKSFSEVQRLQDDNVSLYEKIKYLEQYNRQWTGGRRNAAAAAGEGGLLLPQSGNGSVEVSVFGGGGQKNSRYACFGVSEPGGFDSGDGGRLSSASGAAETRYHKLYEEKINPFKEFNAKEQERGYRNLKLHDKITLTGGRLLLSNKYGRTFAFFYTLLLHFFVFFVLYRSSVTQSAIAHPGQYLPAGMANETAYLPAVADNFTTRTFADTVAENVGTLIESTRELTAQGGRLKKNVDMERSANQGVENREGDPVSSNGTTAGTLSVK